MNKKEKKEASQIIHKMKEKSSTSFNAPIKKVFTISIGTLTREQAEKQVRELMSYTSNPRWLIEYDRKLLIENRKKKLEKLNGVTSFH